MINPLTALKAASAGQKIAIGLGILLLVFVAIKSVQYFIDQNNQAQREVGTLETVNTINKGALENAQNANEAAHNVRNNDDARLAECLRSSRTPENCDKR